MKRIGDGARDAGEAKGLVLRLTLLVMGLKPPQPLPLATVLVMF